MAIKSVFINVADIATSVDFYKKHLGLQPVSVSADAAVLDAVTATITLARIDAHPDSNWMPDNLQRGFRHIGFNVTDLDARVEVLRADGVRFFQEPHDGVGGLRVAFFYDPDGVVIEYVQEAPQYHEVFDQGLVDAFWANSAPERPTFDHVAATVSDPVATHDYWELMGFRLMAGFHLPSINLEITYMRGGDTSLEVFEFVTGETSARPPQIDALGFVAVEITGEAPEGAMEIGNAFAHRLYSDPDGLVYADSRQ